MKKSTKFSSLVHFTLQGQTKKIEENSSHHLYHCTTLFGPKKAHQGLIKAAGKIFEAKDAIHLQPVVPKLRIFSKTGRCGNIPSMGLVYLYTYPPGN